MRNEWMQTTRICPNCGEKIKGYRNKDGLLKLDCTKCHIVMVSKIMSRRHERLDVYAPPHELITN